MAFECFSERGWKNFQCAVNSNEKALCLNYRIALHCNFNLIWQPPPPPLDAKKVNNFMAIIIVIIKYVLGMTSENSSPECESLLCFVFKGLYLLYYALTSFVGFGFSAMPMLARYLINYKTPTHHRHNIVFSCRIDVK